MNEHDLPAGWDDARLADAYRALAARARPERLAVRAIAARATESPQPRPGVGWARLLPAAAVLAATALVVVFVTAMPRSSRPSRLPLAATAATPAGTPAAASASPTATPTSAPSPAPPANVPILDAAALTDLVRRERAGGLAPAWVVTSAPLAPNRGAPGFPSIDECWPTGTCRVIGSINGAGVVAIRQEDRVVPPPLPAAGALIAVRVAQAGPLEYLGAVDPASAAAPLTSTALLTATGAATPGTVVAVRAWLDAGHALFSCGPIPPDDEPLPFECQSNGDFLTAAPVLTITGGNGGISGNGPQPGGVQIQFGAYSGFAPDPADADAYNFAPREGVWLVRAVTYAHAGWDTMHGWLLVGRIDAAPLAAGPSGRDVPGYPTVVSAQQAAAIVAAGGSNGQLLFVEGTLAAAFIPPCTGDLCQVGVLKDTGLPVTATRETLAFAAPAVGDAGIFAMRVRAGLLEYLGWMGYEDGSTFTGTLAAMAAEARPPTPDSPSAPSGPVTFVVRGWLIDQGAPIACPTMPADGWPFTVCGHSWLTPAEYQPAQSAGGRATPPTTGIEVQAFAYGDFAPDPAYLPGGIAHAPREGTWLVRLLTHSDGTRAWEIVARLAP